MNRPRSQLRSWVWTMLIFDVLTLNEINEILGLELLYERTARRLS